MGAKFPTVVSLLAFFLASFASAGDPDMLQDICVADYNKPVEENGFPCRPTANATAADFSTDIIAMPGNTENLQGSLVTNANVKNFPGLNTLGVSIARIDFAPYGQNPPHTHPRATEIVFVLEGELEVGFITTANRLFTKTIKKGEVFVFPRGLVHFQKNNKKFPAAVVAAFNSQLQGTQSIATTLFTASPEVPDYVLATAFQVPTKTVKKIKAKLAPMA